MLFNSLEFLLFFPTVCLCYYVIPHRIRYLFLLVCSYFFYMCWNAKYIILIFLLILILMFFLIYFFMLHVFFLVLILVFVLVTWFVWSSTVACVGRLIFVTWIWTIFCHVHSPFFVVQLYFAQSHTNLFRKIYFYFFEKTLDFFQPFIYVK